MAHMVASEIARINAPAIESCFESEVYNDIVTWSFYNCHDGQFESPKEMIEAYWNERLN